MLRETRIALAAGRNATHSRYNILGKAPVQYVSPGHGILGHRHAVARPKGSMMWRKWLKDVPRVFKWEREDPPEHLKRFHRHGIEWGTQRYQYATVDEELWPKVVLKSEELHLRDVDSWRDAYRLHIEGHFGNLRQRHHVSVPNNYNAVQRYVRAMDHHYQLKKRNKDLPKFHPAPDALLDYEL